MKGVSNKKRKLPSPQILFSGYVKKLSRKFKLWQQRILTLNSMGDILITRINSKRRSRKLPGPPINVTQSGLVRRQGKASDGRWPSKLDLRQSLVLECNTTKFLFFPSIRAVEALNTQLDILCCRKCSEEKIDISTERDTTTEIGVEVETGKRETNSKRWSLCDDVICRDETEMELTLLTKLDRKKSFSLVSLTEFTNTIRASISYDCILSENESVSNKTETVSTKENKENKENLVEEKEIEMCFDFTSGPGYLACKRAKQTLRDIPDNTVTTQHSKRTSLFSPNTQFTLKPILKRHSDYSTSSSISRVRFNASPSVRIVSVVSNSDTQEVETDYVFHYINKYVINSHKQKPPPIKNNVIKKKQKTNTSNTK
eukprot:TRINITY_DN1505_c0_g1_i3.p1 TRINITY_DN1505_c0_g1~~TRINITY_DN1505_c0_g1_i3.p1  ORF type:complete len:372 (+),score=99.18 TRINITY_DN1505_c0_g1_i3:144-1259(+)